MDIQYLVKYLRKTRLILECYHNEDDTIDMFMEEVLEKAIQNWIDEKNGDPKLSDQQWESVRRIVFLRTNPPKTN